MHSISSRRWLHARKGLVTLFLLLSLLPSPTVAQESGPTLLLRPHCEPQKDTGSPFGPLPDNPIFINIGSGRCHLFPTINPLTRETPVLDVGETLDMDLIIQNSPHQEINRVRAWIAYDPTIFEGTTLSLSSAFPLPFPGEADFSQEEGYIKIHASTDTGGRTDDTMVVARIQMRILSTPNSSTTLSFYDAGPLPENHTTIVRGSGLLEQNVLNPSSLGQLQVRLQRETPEEGPAAPPTVPPSSAPPTPLPPPLPLPPPANQPTEIFTLLQVQNLRATTEGSSVFLAWDPLPSSQLIGYNLYYGTVSGEYVQRRSMDSAMTSATLRSLPQNSQYFFAIRGVSDAQTETAFSQEVAMTVGSPDSSSAPLHGNIIERERTISRHARTLAGSTGTPSLLLIIVLGSACVGTTLAFRRQCIAQTHL